MVTISTNLVSRECDLPDEERYWPARSHPRLAKWTSSVRVLLSYTASFLWHERPRFLAAVLAVAFSAVLITVQTGMVLGIYSATSIPIDHTSADVWIGGPRLPSVDAGLGISEEHLTRVAGLSGVARVEPLVLGYSAWVRANGTRDNCIVIGSRLADGALGAVGELSAEQRVRLGEPGAVILDQSDAARLGVRSVGDTAEVAGRRVRIVGLVTGLKGLSGPFVFCSMDTARQLIGMSPDQITYLLVGCRQPEDGAAVVHAVRRHADLSGYTSADFSQRTRLHWLTQTPGGLATVLMVALALLVGAVVTRQALYAATIASVREYALLRALGIRQRRIATFVLGQSLGVGVAGVLVALPLIAGLGQLVAVLIGARMLLPWWLLGTFLGLTLLMAALSGLATLRSLRLMDPVMLLR